MFSFHFLTENPVPRFRFVPVWDSTRLAPFLQRVTHRARITRLVLQKGNCTTSLRGSGFERSISLYMTTKAAGSAQSTVPGAGLCTQDLLSGTLYLETWGIRSMINTLVDCGVSTVMMQCSGRGIRSEPISAEDAWLVFCLVLGLDLLTLLHYPKKEWS